jgi:hypothetical protein
MSYSHPTNVIYYGQHTIINCRIEKKWILLNNYSQKRWNVNWDFMGCES